MFAAPSTALPTTAVLVTAVSPPPLPSLPSPPPLPSLPTAAVDYGKAAKQHPCPTCGKCFPRQSNLTRHEKNLHTNSAKEECGLCGQHFRPGALLRHQKECQGLATAVTAAPPLVQPVLACASPASESPLSSLAAAAEPTAATERLLLTSHIIDVAAADFVTWLQEPVLPSEHMIRKVATPRAVEQLQEGLRQVVREVDRELPLLFSAGVQLRLLVVPDVVAALVSAMQGRGVKASTVYPVALLLKKVCVWLCSRQSRATRQYIAPDTLPGWPLICHHCSASTTERKRDHLARRLRGTDEHKHMTSEEKNVLLSACLAVLDGIQRTAPESSFGVSWTDFTNHFIVALLLLGLAPRQETFRALTTDMVRPPGSDRRTPEQYILDGEHGKTRMVYYCAVHPVLTSSMRFYLERVLGVDHRGPLFLQMGGGARQDFSVTTRKLTKQYVGRPITAGKFRMSVATDLLGKPGVKGRALADIQGHSEATQRAHYVGMRMAADVRICQDALLQGVEVPAGMVSVAAV